MFLCCPKSKEYFIYKCSAHSQKIAYYLYYTTAGGTKSIVPANFENNQMIIYLDCIIL